MGCGNLMLPATRSRKASCLATSKDCLSNSAAAADTNAVQRFLVLPSHRMSGSGARGKSVRHTARHRICSVTAWYMASKSESHSVGGFLNRRFKWRFWVLLPPWAKVPRVRRREISPRSQPRNIPAPGRETSPCRRQKRENPPALDIRRKTCYSFPVTGDDGRGGPEPREEMPAGRPVTGMRVWKFPNSGGTTDGYRSP